MTYTSHDDPVHRTGHGHLARVDLAPFDLEKRIEQLWLSKVDDGYEVGCIPFWAYGLALGDVVAVSNDGYVSGIVRKSGRRVLRVLFLEPRPSTDSRVPLRGVLDSVGLLSEWNGDRFVAIDVPDESEMRQVYDVLNSEIQNGTAFGEWGDSREFSTPT
ncbi:DUF4265 domain-containing protein [Streptomyces sp. NPDC006290]|uniref:DUF4265 domain-containing protein n=1 Tax=Streptomyces sp. NPDC006290 TaxID=3156745 RepID=UPI0033AD5A43